MTGGNEPSSAPTGAPKKSIAKHPARKLELSEQIILFHGRYSRKKFWRWALALPLLLFLMLPPLVAMSSTTGPDTTMALLLMGLPFVWLYCKLIAHRLHDLGWAGWWSLAFILVPILMFREWTFGSLAIFLGGFTAIGCLRGAEGPNQYGPDPRVEPEPESKPSV